MPGRKTPLVIGCFYHILNRGISLQPTFKTQKDFWRGVELLRYYQNQKPPLRYSYFIMLSRGKREVILKNFAKGKLFLAEILAYCLMPNHFHFILKQLKDDGISKFMSNFTNSYTRYFNTKNKRNGPLFQGKFKAVRIESDEQLLHLSRYIHLNPYSSYVVKTLGELKNYQFSSLPEYLGDSSKGFCNKEIILDEFGGLESYQKFVFDRADYQRRLEEIKHLALENS